MNIIEEIPKVYAKDPEQDPIGKFMTDLSRKSPPSKEECDKLFQRLSKGSDSARNELIERHLRLVASIALKFKHSQMPVEDLIVILHILDWQYHLLLDSMETNTLLVLQIHGSFYHLLILSLTIS